MTVIEDMQRAREFHRSIGPEESAAMPDSELCDILGSALMDLARANPENCTARVTQALALFHVWEANRR